MRENWKKLDAAREIIADDSWDSPASQARATEALQALHQDAEEMLKRKWLGTRRRMPCIRGCGTSI